ncbi:3'-5' exonuclease [Pseudonocardia phyllosphaerae]|uniref:3'-5' exonuclease n=1 Tax=Pseudonocardia phyllosphaerae TaxID=3390502 RepID=UPI00397ACD73
MGVIISKEFHRSLDIDGSLKPKAWDFVTKLTKDPDLTGLDVKIPKGPADKRVRTARVDLNHRAVIFAVGDEAEPMWLLAAIRPHDQAYAEAEKLVLSVNPANGAMEVYTPSAVEATVAGFRHRSSNPEDAPQLLPFTIEELVGIGIESRVATEAINVPDEDALLALATDLPAWQQKALLDLATGSSLDDVRATYGGDAPTGDEPVDPVTAARRPASQLEFAYLETDDELRRMLEGDFAEWRTYLHPTQRDIAYRKTYNGPFRLAGGAGTGKTVVALHRTAFLSRTPGARVLLSTFTRNLAAVLQTDLRGLVSADEAQRVTVNGVDQLVRRVVTAVDGQQGPPLGDRERDAVWNESLHAAGVPEDLAEQLTPTFLAAEYRAVVMALPEHTREAYLKAKRIGRGVRLNRVQRAAVWRVVEAFEKSLAAQGRTTYDVLACRAARIANDPANHAAVPRFDHVVVDEGQDLHAGHWRMLRGLVDRGPNDLFICEDGHQRIYGDRLVLSHFGIETRGRSRRLTLNYRTTRENLALAMGVISEEDIVDLDGDPETVAGYRSAFAGPVPQLRGFSSPQEELAFVAATVQDWIAADVPPESIAVVGRRNHELEHVKESLRNAGVPIEFLPKDGSGHPGSVKVTSMHRAKGTEFTKVVVVAVRDHVVPLDFVFSQRPESEHPLIRAQERSLLYVACSRARNQLVITWHGAASPFLPVAVNG